MPRLQDLITQNPLKCFIAERAGSQRCAIAAADRMAAQLERSGIEAVYAHQERALRALLAEASKTPLYRDLAARRQFAHVAKASRGGKKPPRIEIKYRLGIRLIAGTRIVATQHQQVAYA